MEVKFDCPYCDRPLTADTTLAPGGKMECAGCHELVLIPAGGIEPGMKLGDFRIEKVLGVGGMGEVFLATQEAMDRPVALKVLPPAVAGDPALVERFMQEARMAGKLEHPNVVTAFYAGQDAGYHYIAMSFIQGEDLEARLKRQGRLTEDEALPIVYKVAKALAYAWDKYKLLHRDIKPANIMIASDGEVKLMDMGIAKALTEDSGLTVAGVLLGTPYYMSPEQAKNVGQLDCRADIYSLGATLFHLVTGSRPYDGPTAISVVAKHLNDPVPLAQEICPQVSLPCARLIAAMMAKKIERRPRDWQALIADIERVMENRNPRTLQLKATDEEVRDILSAPLLDEPAPVDDELDVRPTGTAFTGPGGTIAIAPAAAPAPAPVSTRDYLDTLPANPAMPRSLKLAFLGVALAIVIVLGILITPYFLDVVNRQKAVQHDQATTEKGLAIEEMRTVSAVEDRLAMENLRGKLRRIVEEMAALPEETDRHLTALRALQAEAAGTPVQDVIDGHINRLEALRERQRHLHGTWAGNGIRFTFLPPARFRALDGTAVTEGHYRLVDGNIRFIIDGKAPYEWPYRLDGDRLTLMPKADVTVELHRQ